MSRMLSMSFLLFLLGVFGMTEHVVGAALNVDCDRNERITDAIASAQSGDRVHVRGTCREIVVITKDDLTLFGIKQGGQLPVIDPGNAAEDVITINGAKRVIVRNFILQGGWHGLRAEDGATVQIRDVIAQGNAAHGMVVDRNATASLTDIGTLNNGVHGIALRTNASAVLCGNVHSNNNGDAGIHIFLGASAWFGRGRNTPCDTVAATNIEANNNFDGVRLSTSGSLFTRDATLLTQNNGDNGLHFTQNSTAQFFQGTTVTALNNPGGDIRVTSGSVVNFGGAVTCGTLFATGTSVVFPVPC